MILEWVGSFKLFFTNRSVIEGDSCRIKSNECDKNFMPRHDENFNLASDTTIVQEKYSGKFNTYFTKNSCSTTSVFLIKKVVTFVCDDFHSYISLLFETIWKVDFVFRVLCDLKTIYFYKIDFFFVLNFPHEMERLWTL